MSALGAIAVGLGCMMIVMLLLWLRQRATHNAGIVDVAWTFGTGALSVFFAIVADGWSTRRWIVACMAGVWALRLGAHVMRRVMSETEDGRYRMLRERWGDRTQTYLFAFFQIQATWALLFALPMLLAASNPSPQLSWLDAVGVAIWLIAVSGEAIADAQLLRFRANPGNKLQVCRDGLWRYSRHPNYFFEWLHWWAYVALAVSGGWAWGWLALGGPLVMWLFLTKVTGIPPTEAEMIRSRGDAYREYQRTTNALFPWPPRKRSAARASEATA